MDSKERPINYIYGPLICGDALDINGNYVLTGSWREKKQIEIWDLRKMQLLKGVEWIPQVPTDKTLIYSARFSNISSKFIVAGGSGTNEIRIFKQNYDVNLDYECLEIIKDAKKSVYTLDFCHETSSFVWGDGNGAVGIVDIL